MDLEQVSTARDFITFLRQLAPRAGDYAGSLEEYLRAVHRVATTHQEEPPTWRLLAHVLADALSTAPSPFDPAWLEYTAPPAVVEDPEAAIADPFAALQHMLRYQIADLHRMAEIGTTNDPSRYWGIDSPTGHRWYNFDPQSFLECASAWGDGDRSTECSWADLAIFLWLGQIYE
jgi:hypothetical protein